jgi:hypothetical protein
MQGVEFWYMLGLLVHKWSLANNVCNSLPSLMIFFSLPVCLFLFEYQTFQLLKAEDVMNSVRQIKVRLILLNKLLNLVNLWGDC